MFGVNFFWSIYYKTTLLLFFVVLGNLKAQEQLRLVRPTDLEVSAGSASHFDLSWKDTSNGENGFVIERKQMDRNYWEVVGFVPENVTSFQSGGCLANTFYLHKVKAVTHKFFSEDSNVIGATTKKHFSKQQSTIIESSNQRQGENTFVKTEDGTLQLYFGSFSGVGDRSKSRIARKISMDNGKSWGEQEIIFENDSLSLFHPSAIQVLDGIIGVAYSKKVMDKWEAKKVFRFSRDGGKSWSGEIQISDRSYPYTTGSHDRFVRLSNNQILHIVHGRIPNRLETKNRIKDWEREEGYGIKAYKEHPKGRQFGTDIYSTSDMGKTWYKVNEETILTHENPYGLGEYGFYEASLVEWKPGHLAIFGRNATGFLYVSHSQDFGKTWSEPESAGVQNPLAPIRVAKIPNSNVIVLLQCPHVDLFGSWGNGPRFILASRISHDGGLTWNNYKELEYDGTHHYAYPAVFFDKGTVHLAYWKTTLQNNKWKKIELAYRQEPVEWFTTK